MTTKMIIASLSIVAITFGSLILGSVYGWKVGLGIGLIAWGLKEIS